VSIETGLYSHLTTDSDVSALVGTRVYPLKLPQGYTLPAISYQRVSGDRLATLSGPTGRANPRFQIDCWASTYSGVRDLASKVRQALDGHKGGLGGEDDVGGISIEGDRDLFEENTEVFRVTMDFFIPHFETA